MTKPIDIPKDELAKLVADGLDFMACGKVLGCSNTTIAKYCRRYGIEKPEKPNYDEQVKELFEKGLSRQEIADEIGVSLSAVKRIMGRLRIQYSPEKRGQIIGRVLKEKYKNGEIIPPVYEHPITPDGRKRIREYHRKNADKVRAKREATCLERYGVKNVFSSKEFQKRIKKTNIEKYGYTSPMKNPEVRDKMSRILKETLKKKYGHDEKANKIIERYQKLGRKLTSKEMIETLGLSQSNSYILMRKYDLEKYVKLETNVFEQEIGNFLEAHHIKYECHNRAIIRPQELDFFIPEFNLAIEANDMGTHNSTVSTFGAEPKSKMYHYNKSKNCEDKGVRLIHVWDYEWYNERTKPILESIILSACGEVESVYARKCKVEVKKPIELKEFFDENHIAGYKGGKVAVCLTYEGKVVMAYIFGSPYFGRGKYEWEVIRATTRRGYRVVGGASRIWRYFLKEYRPTSCVFYVDYNYFDGHSLENLGFKYQSCHPTPKNFIVGEGRVTGRNPGKHKENEELIKQGRIWRFYTSGSKTYVWSKD